MWNVLLVEDEAFVRRSLKQLIRWEDMGFTIAREAADGQEALEMMRADPPDLVVSDIVMPGMDGIELLKRAREEGLEASFVMLTCMNEFEYARQALDYGASAYLLKLSMNEQSLGDTLAKVKRELARNLNVRSQAVADPYQRLYREAWQTIHQTGGARHGAGAGAGAGARTGAGGGAGAGPATEQMRYRPEGKADTVWIGSFLHGADPFTLDDFHRLGLVTSGSRSVAHTFVHSGQTTVFVWNPVAVRPWPVEKGACPWPAACSAVVGGEEVTAAWSRVLRHVDHAWYEGRTGLMLVASGEGGGAGAAAEGLPRPAAAEMLTWRTEREWIRSFEQRNLDEFRLLLDAGWKEARERCLPMAAVKELAVRLDRLLSRIAGRSATAEEELLHAVSHAELRDRLLASAERYADRDRAAAQLVTGHREIDKALDYIHRHYCSDVTLKAVAAMVAMDEAYFSGLFKKKTGVTLIHYLQQVRVDHAKQLLAQSELPATEIGERVGFPNANYFIKIFKRWTGQTPSEFRSAERT